VKEIEKKQEERLSRENWPIRNLQFDKNRGLSGLIGLQKLCIAFLSEVFNNNILYRQLGTGGSLGHYYQFSQFWLQAGCLGVHRSVFSPFFLPRFHVLSKASINFCCFGFCRDK
jgi:hypothetical protein